MAILVSDLSFVKLLEKYGVVSLFSSEEEGQFGTRYRVAATQEEGMEPVGSDAPSTVYVTEDKIAQILDLAPINVDNWGKLLEAHTVSKFQGQDSGAMIVKIHRISDVAKSALDLLAAKIPAKAAPKAKEASAAVPAEFED